MKMKAEKLNTVGSLARLPAGKNAQRKSLAAEAFSFTNSLLG
jgi:hypothetical protein